MDMSYEVHGCPNCGATYAGKLPSEDEYQRYYSLFSKYDVGVLSEDNVRLHQMLADSIARHCPSSTKILDIGCGDGHLLFCLKERGMHELYGIDPAPHAPMVAMNSYGIGTISTGFLSDVVNNAGIDSYNLFCLSAVLEHLSAPGRQLKELLKRVQNGTCIAVEVPDLESFDAAHGEPLGELSLEHINYFSRSSLRNLFASVGCVELCCQRVKHSSGGSLLALYRKENALHSGVQVKDTELMQNYVRISKERLHSLLHKVVSKLHEPFIIYGAGIELEGLFLRAVRTGYDAGRLTEELERRYGITTDRARFISRDQLAKATESLSRVRMQEIGIEEAVWVHTAVGKTYRGTHVRMNGRRFRLDKGLYDSAVGRWVQPGELPNCHCTKAPIIPGMAAPTVPERKPEWLAA